MNTYYFSDRGGLSFTAWGKAPADIEATLSRLGGVNLTTAFQHAQNRATLKALKCSWFLNPFVWLKIKRHSVFFLQYPEELFVRQARWLGRWILGFIKRITGSKLVVLVHDLPELRGAFEQLYRHPVQDRKCICRMADALIVHNAHMAKWLVEHGTDEAKLVNLEIFDYLTGAPLADVKHPIERTVTIAGCLRPDKVPYLRGLPSVANVEWHLYGKCFADNNVSGPNIHYHGCFPPEQLPTELTHGFGLVWDGDSVETCSGSTGEYLRINNPHKLSLYIASGMPVIIWREAAEADFVLQHKVGVVISSLHDIRSALDALTDAQIQTLRENTLRLAAQLRSGHYTETAFRNAVRVAQHFQK